MNNKVGLILEGGALRGLFTAGVLDYLMEQEIEFPYVIGVSAGCGNASNYTSKQIGRSKKVIAHEDGKSYFGLNQLVENKTLLNLDMVVVEYAHSDYPFDFDSFFASNTECESVIINCETGLPEYNSTYKDNDELLKYNKASMSLPFVCDPIEINGKYYMDGSLVDSLPCQRALDKGCNKMVVVMTKPIGAKVTDYSKIKKLVELSYRKKYPKLCEAILNRKKNYDQQLEFMLKLESEGKVYIIQPEGQTISHFENNPEKLNNFYDYGYATMKKQFSELMKFLNE